MKALREDKELRSLLWDVWAMLANENVKGAADTLRGWLMATQGEK